jgi:galactokinase
LTHNSDLFVPGRLCLFGEHSDWAGEYREKDPSVVRGMCLIAGTRQGIYALAGQGLTGFTISQLMPDGTMSQPIHWATSKEARSAADTPGGFHCYAAGTASVMLEAYSRAGVSLQVYRRTLPLRKGLSSSAAICVATARAFNIVHRLGMTTEEEMDAAYRGELLTGSHCGRMDQACAYGEGPSLLTLDGSIMTHERIRSTGTIPMLFADLGGTKDTKRILADLNRCFAEGSIPLRTALGSLNAEIVEQAVEAVSTGNSAMLGELMNRAQEVFDRMAAPCCPDQLTAPILHRTLKNPAALELAWGGKGVGSQGDGTVQFVCRGPEERNELERVLENEAGMHCFRMNI